MSAPKPKVATKQKLLESIEHLQMSLAQAQKDAMTERQQRYQTEEKTKRLEGEARELNYQLAQSKNREHLLEVELAEKHARAEALELALRLVHKAEKPADARAVKDPVKWGSSDLIDSMRYAYGSGVIGRP